MRLPVLQGLLPVERSRVRADVLAGLTLAALGVPEVLGYAKIAGMPLVTGLYTMLLPMAVFAVLGSSRHLVVAADSATAAILAAALASPGPRVTTTAPGAPVRSALVAAMIVAAVSPCARTKRSPAASAAPTTSRLGPPPGTPNTSRVPAPASAATIAPAGPIAGEAVLASKEAPSLTVVILWCA